MMMIWGCKTAWGIARKMESTHPHKYFLVKYQPKYKAFAIKVYDKRFAFIGYY